jgi:hypothetical protein
MSDSESESENEHEHVTGLEELADVLLADDELENVLILDNAEEAENRRNGDILLSPSETISSDDVELLDMCMMDCILRDTIRGVHTLFPGIKKGSELDLRLSSLWKVYRNTRLFKGDFLGLHISFKSAIDKLAPFYEEYDAMVKSSRAKDVMSLNKFYISCAVRLDAIPVKRTLFLKKLQEHIGNVVVAVQRSRVSLLTRDMEVELCSWIYRCNHRGSAPTGCDIRTKSLFLCRSNELHWCQVLKAHPSLRLESCNMVSKTWFKKFLMRGKLMKPPLHIASKRAQKSEEGRLQITRPMLDSFYDLVIQILGREGMHFLPRQIWNYDESGLKMNFCAQFCYGITGAAWSKAGTVGNGKHVTFGVFINMIGRELGKDYFPTFLTGGKKETLGVFKKAVETHFGPLAAAQVKEGKASMDDVLFTELLDLWSSICLPHGEVHLLFVDGHDSHERHNVLSIARRKNIIIVRFPSHCTHLMQPLDLAYFKAFKSAFLKSMQVMMKRWGNSHKTITAAEFCGCVREATIVVARNSVIVSGFKTMGLSASKDGESVVVDRNAIKEFKLMSADRAETQQDNSSLVFTVDGDTVDLANLNPRETRVCKAQRLFWVREGMELPAAKPFNYSNPVAVEMTTSP